MPHSKLMTSIELLGTEVVPMVKQILAESLASKYVKPVASKTFMPAELA
jgi:hypothetical protein